MGINRVQARHGYFTTNGSVTLLSGELDRDAVQAVHEDDLRQIAVDILTRDASRRFQKPMLLAVYTSLAVDFSFKGAFIDAADIGDKYRVMLRYFPGRIQNKDCNGYRCPYCTDTAIVDVTTHSDRRRKFLCTTCHGNSEGDFDRGRIPRSSV